MAAITFKLTEFEKLQYVDSHFSNKDIRRYNDMIVQEVYIGTIPEIQEMFDELKTLRSQYRLFRERNNVRHFERFEKLVENFWGFKAFSFDVKRNSIPNAYTYCVARSIDVNGADVMETTSKGYRFKKGSNCAAITYITSGLLENKNISDEEVFAIFLHEVGHSFAQRSPFIAAQYEMMKNTLALNIMMTIIMSVIATIGLESIIPAGVGLSNLQYYSNFTKRIRVEFDKAVRKVPLLREAGITFDIAINTVMNTLSNIVHTVGVLSGFDLAIGMMGHAALPKAKKDIYDVEGRAEAYGRSEERLSDDFAAMYGFGPQLATGLVKISNPDNQSRFNQVIYNTPIIKKIFGSVEQFAIEIDGAIGGHPGTADRIFSILEGLKHDLDKDKDLAPKVKKELKANISQIENEIKKMKKNEGEIAKFSDEYRKALILLGLEDGNTEDFLEKKFTDRKELKRFYDERRVRKESAKIAAREAKLRNIAYYDSNLVE